MEEAILLVQEHDRALVGADRIVEQRQGAVQGPVKVEAGGHLGEDAQQSFGILLLMPQLGRALDNTLLKLAGQALRLSEQPPILNGDTRLVGQRTEHLQVLLGIGSGLVALGREHSHGLCRRA